MLPLNIAGDYVYRDGLLLGGEKEAAEGGRRHFHLYHLGTPRLITNQSGQQVSLHHYWPFGVEVTSIRQEIVKGYERDDPVKFTAHQREFNGGTYEENQNYLDYMHARYYNRVLGRFLSTDPKESGKPALSQSWNKYAYVRNNPIIYSDPMEGKSICKFITWHLGRPIHQYELSQEISRDS